LAGRTCPCLLSTGQWASGRLLVVRRPRPGPGGCGPPPGQRPWGCHAPPSTPPAPAPRVASSPRRIPRPASIEGGTPPSPHVACTAYQLEFYFPKRNPLQPPIHQGLDDDAALRFIPDLVLD